MDILGLFLTFSIRFYKHLIIKSGTMINKKVIRRSPEILKTPGSGVMEYWYVEKRQQPYSHYNTPAPMLRNIRKLKDSRIETNYYDGFLSADFRKKSFIFSDLGSRFINPASCAHCMASKYSSTVIARQI